MWQAHKISIKREEVAKSIQWVDRNSAVCCPKCKLAYRSQQDLKRHLEVVHREFEMTLSLGSKGPKVWGSRGLGIWVLGGG